MWGMEEVEFGNKKMLKRSSQELACDATPSGNISFNRVCVNAAIVKIIFSKLRIRPQKPEYILQGIGLKKA